MTKERNFASVVVEWAHEEPSVEAVILIGSQARHATDILWSADAHSDWDFHVVTSHPDRFFESSWTTGLSGFEMRAYAVREARLGDVPKVSIVFAQAEADFVILPSARLSQLKDATALGKHRTDDSVKRDLEKLAIVIRPGWRFLKGAASWEPFYRTMVAEVADPRIGNSDIHRMAEAFVCDYVWAKRKLLRGEFVAVQRLLHRELAETNFRLLHEVKLRRGERSMPDARRLERVAAPEELFCVSIDAKPDARSLGAALDKGAATLRSLVKALVGNAWKWPDL